MNASDSENFGAENIGVDTVATKDLVANPHNPRILFDKQPMETLKASIKKVGILVPLTVYKDRKKFIILDGQRRWICAKDLDLPSLPVNQVRKPNTVQNIVTMFQIHKLREDWELMPTALKVQLLMKELSEKSEKRLSELTGLDQSVVVRCKKLLSYSKKYQDLMLHQEPNERIKADFFIELYAVRNDRTVNNMDWFTKDIFTKKMLAKYQAEDSGLKSVTDFRIVKQHVNNARKANKLSQISKRLQKFTNQTSLTPDMLRIEGADDSNRAKKLTKTIQTLNADISEIDVEKFYGEEELWTSLEDLKEGIVGILRAAARRPK